MPRRKLSPQEKEDLAILRGMANALNEALEIVGSGAELGRIIGLTGQGVSRWELCPPHWCIPVEYATERQVTRYRLRPDIFGDGKDACPRCSTRARR